MRHHHFVSLLILPALGLVSAPPAQAAGPRVTPRQLIAQYFTDLNAHHFHAAWLLEAPCRVTVSVPNKSGGPMGSMSFPGKSAWSAPKNAHHPILSSASVMSINSLHIAALERHHVLAYGVSGMFRFDYSAVAANPSFNNKHRSGFHVVKIALWQCHGRLGIEPSYWTTVGGGPLNWT